MKYPFLVFLALVMSCSKEEAQSTGCRLTKIAVSSGGFLTVTTYDYTRSGKINKQTRTRNGTILFDYTYSYDADGKVLKVDDLDSYSQWEYDATGKIKTIFNYTKTGTLKQTSTYTWSVNKVEIKSTKPELANPFQIREFEFLNDNVVRETTKIFSGNQPNVLLSMSETIFEDFDTALSPFYVVSSARPGYNADISKNNARREVKKNVVYNGTSIQESTSTSIFSYTYNASDIMATSKAATNEIFFSDTEAIYDRCNN
jgi:YD repeat-containing protein